MAKLIGLKAENFKRLLAVEFLVKDGATIISGKNEAGKSSVLDAIQYAIAPKTMKEITKPIHNGKETCQIIVETDEYIIKRYWTSPENSYLKVTNTDGIAVSKSPQKLLDVFFSTISFDPLLFTSVEEDKALKMLLALTGKEEQYQEAVANRKEVYDKRTDQNRFIKQVEAELAALPEFEREPEKVEIKELTESLAKIEKHNMLIETAKERLTSHIDNQERAHQEHERLKAELASLLERIEVVKKSITDNEKLIATANDWLTDPMNQPKSPEEVNKKIADSEAVNLKHKQYLERQDKEKLLATYKKVSQDYTDKIVFFEDAIKNVFVESDLGIDGLCVTADGIELNEVPLKQLSMSQRIKLGFAILVAQNPKFRIILIRDASLFDEDNLALVKELCDTHNFQALLEIAGTADSGVVIEDGRNV